LERLGPAALFVLALLTFCGKDSTRSLPRVSTEYFGRSSSAGDSSTSPVPTSNTDLCQGHTIRSWQSSPFSNFAPACGQVAPKAQKPPLNVRTNRTLVFPICTVFIWPGAKSSTLPTTCSLPLIFQCSRGQSPPDVVLDALIITTDTAHGACPNYSRSPRVAELSELALARCRKQGRTDAVSQLLLAGEGLVEADSYCSDTGRRVIMRTTVRHRPSGQRAARSCPGAALIGARAFSAPAAAAS